jgi:hypothetical protein
VGRWVSGPGDRPGGSARDEKLLAGLGRQSEFRRLFMFELKSSRSFTNLNKMRRRDVKSAQQLPLVL